MSKVTITWSEDGRADLREFGIQIPLLASRSEQILTYLRGQFPTLAQDANIFRTLRPEPVSKQEMLLAHSLNYVEDICGQNERRVADCYELFDSAGRPNRYIPADAKRPLSELTVIQRKEAGGTLASAQIALDRGFVYFLGGGMHHASRDIGRGFCLLNDVVIAARSLQKAGAVKTVWVIDNDVHKGDGTAAICRMDDSIVTLSIHRAKGWPLDESKVLADGSPNPAHIPSDIDIGIEVGDEENYLEKLGNGLSTLRSQFPSPDFVVVVNGSDPYEKDILPSSNGIRLSLDQMLERDQMVHTFVSQMNIPQLWVMAGGYGPEVWRVHAQFLESLLRNPLQ